MISGSSGHGLYLDLLTELVHSPVHGLWSGSVQCLQTANQEVTPKTGSDIDWTTVMTPNIQIFVQVVLLCCVVTTSLGVSLIGKGHFQNLKTK